jgi:alkane 1-monooxygenase
MSAFECPGCGFIYDERAGNPREGLPAGTPWSAVPDAWFCPDCCVRDKVDFVALDETAAASEPAKG